MRVNPFLRNIIFRARSRTHRFPRGDIGRYQIYGLLDRRTDDGRISEKTIPGDPSPPGKSAKQGVWGGHSRTLPWTRSGLDSYSCLHLYTLPIGQLATCQIAQLADRPTARLPYRPICQSASWLIGQFGNRPTGQLGCMEMFGNSWNSLETFGDVRKCLATGQLPNCPIGQFASRPVG